MEGRKQLRRKKLRKGTCLKDKKIVFHTGMWIHETLNIVGVGSVQIMEEKLDMYRLGDKTIRA